jgi:hypothetical protein
VTGKCRGAPVGNQNGLRHGRRSRQAIEERKAAARLLREAAGLVEEAGRALCDVPVPAETAPPRSAAVSCARSRRRSRNSLTS